MKQIIWDKLNSFEKLIFILGWIGVLNLIFWIIIIIVYSYTRDKYKTFFNSETFKVVYVFGWIYFAFIVIMIFIVLLLLTFLSSINPIIK